MIHKPPKAETLYPSDEQKLTDLVYRSEQVRIITIPFRVGCYTRNKAETRQAIINYITNNFFPRHTWSIVRTEWGYDVSAKKIPLSVPENIHKTFATMTFDIEMLVTRHQHLGPISESRTDLLDGVRRYLVDDLARVARNAASFALDFYLGREEV
jgi:hypothetical protein